MVKHYPSMKIIGISEYNHDSSITVSIHVLLMSLKLEQRTLELLFNLRLSIALRLLVQSVNQGLYEVIEVREQ